ncbi:MAG: hypothetical protein ABIP27_18175 [Flavobacterium circumlabens]|uniref:hypothetical protein n=1 Tax=Flavobacterium circumlabens TaxID=2133765 RepID=UPI003266F8FF
MKKKKKKEITIQAAPEAPEVPQPTVKISYHLNTNTMITDNNRNYDPDEHNSTEDNQSYTEQYEQEKLGDEDTQEEQFLDSNQDAQGGDYLDNEFSNALERDDEENTEEDFDDGELEEEETDADDLDDDLVEDYDENDREPDPETFSDDSLKID